MRRRTSAVCLGLLALSGAGGCSLLVHPDLAAFDAAASADSSVDAAPVCTASCDDGIACTVDRCGTDGQCVHESNTSLCPRGQLCDVAVGCMMRPCANDGECDDRDLCTGTERCVSGACIMGLALQCDDRNACNGVERCDSTRGCQPGTAPCDDRDPCTTDTCAQNGASNPTCGHSIADADRDGYAPLPADGASCRGGNDCDDSDPAVHPGAAETCNGRDDNCDGRADEGLSCPANNDSCGDALAVRFTGPASREFTVVTTNASSDVDSRCGIEGAPDLWYAVTWPASADLTAELTPRSPATADPILVVREGCGGPDVACNDDVAAVSSVAARVWVRGRLGLTGTRTVYLAADSRDAASAGTFALRLDVTAAANASTCGGALFDVSRGGTLLGTVPRRTSQERPSCGQNGAEDIVAYRGAVGQVRALAWSTVFRPTLYARASDCSSGPELGVCDSGNPASLVFSHLGATSYIFVDGAGGQDPYQLQVLAP